MEGLNTSQTVIRIQFEQHSIQQTVDIKWYKNWVFGYGFEQSVHIYVRYVYISNQVQTLVQLDYNQQEPVNGWVNNLLRPSISKLTSIASDNGVSSGRRQAIIWNNAGILSIGLLWTNFREISIEILTFSFKKCAWNCCLWNGGHFVLASMW